MYVEARDKQHRLSVREHFGGIFYLTNPGDCETVRLLMRGMPMPATFGFPLTDGTICSNFVKFVRQFHPFISIFCVHPLCPFTGFERLIIFICSVAFNFLWTCFFAFQIEKRNIDNNWSLPFVILLLTAKHSATVLYAVLIRQLVICPCLYAPFIEHAFASQTDVMDVASLEARGRTLKRWKSTGNRVLLVLFFFHIVMIAVVTHVMSNWKSYNLQGYRSPHRIFLHRILVSEAFNFCAWFVKFLPLFLALYPIHRAMWFQGGSFTDYVTRRKYTSTYLKSPNFIDPDFPRCVVPETNVTIYCMYSGVSEIAP